MREMLRSQTRFRLGKVSDEEKVVQKEKVYIKNTSYSLVLGDEGLEAPSSFDT